MPKQKTLKAAAKRFKVTGSGKILHGHSYARHHKKVKSKSLIRRQKLQKAFEGKIEKRIGRLLPYSR